MARILPQGFKEEAEKNLYERDSSGRRHSGGIHRSSTGPRKKTMSQSAHGEGTAQYVLLRELIELSLSRRNLLIALWVDAARISIDHAPLAATLFSTASFTPFPVLIGSSGSRRRHNRESRGVSTVMHASRSPYTLFTPRRRRLLTPVALDSECGGRNSDLFLSTAVQRRYNPPENCAFRRRDWS